MYKGPHSRWTNAAAGYNEVVLVTHAASGLDDLTLVIFNDLDPLQALHLCQSNITAFARRTYYPEREAPFGHVRRIGLLSLAPAKSPDTTSQTTHVDSLCDALAFSS